MEINNQHTTFCYSNNSHLAENIDKTYIDIFLKHELLNFHDTFPYLNPKTGFQES